jgi:predicted transcriptional regulator of viral defense system
MKFRDFYKEFRNLGIVSVHQAHAQDPGLDKNALGRWVRQGWLIRLRNGFYAFPDSAEAPGFIYYAANRIYRPSYISLHSALAFYGMIPESVVQVTSVCSLKTCTFKNSLGEFSYNSVRESLMLGYDTRTDGQFTVLWATPEKARLDLIYLYPFYRTSEDFEDLRLDREYMRESLKWDHLRELAAVFGSKILLTKIKLIEEIYR